VFEKDARVGGHANTIDAMFDGVPQAVDTGFIVYNYRNYPNLTAMFEHLDVPTKWSDMSFGFSLDHGRFEYACDNLSTIFAQPWRVLDVRFLNTFREILRVTKVAPKDLESGAADGLSLGEWLEMRRFSRWFRERFLLPMGGAIWSTKLGDVLDFPAASFIRFFVNHDLMTGLDPAMRWRTVDGGSREYVRRIVAELGPRITVGRGVAEIDRSGLRPVVRFEDGASESFDQVIIAAHGPQAHAMMDAGAGEQRAVLANFRTSRNRAVTHSDPALMPKRRKVWSSWNFLSNGMDDDRDRPAPVTYWMNRLQNLPKDKPLFVTLNPETPPRPDLTFATMEKAHPQFDAPAEAAVRGLKRELGRDHIWLAGAWMGSGFHEDGLKAGLACALSLGGQVPWTAEGVETVAPSASSSATDQIAVGAV
jgi:predicted NAD/FAD-binding protein